MIDTALLEREASGTPIRIAVIGAGAAARAVALQLATPPKGIRLAAIINRTASNAERSFREAGVKEWKRVDSAKDAEASIQRGVPVFSDNPDVATHCDAVDVVIECTGTLDYALNVVLAAFDHGKDVVLGNAELDSLLGPILNVRAQRAGLVITHTDGEEPGVAMTLLRYLRGCGLRTVAGGNLKGMVDHYRTPETQKAFAQKYDQDPYKVTSFADASKLSLETTILANATGFAVGKRGMYGPPCEHVKEMGKLLPADQMLDTGLVDFALGAAPYTGAFVIVYEENPLKQAQMGYVKMGDGPFYVFYTPFHLPHIQMMSTIGRAVIYRDPTVVPVGGPVCEVVTMAKKDMKAGETLDGVGGFTAYGLIDNSSTARGENALPLSLSEGCTLRRDVAKDQLITFADVTMPNRKVVDQLWNEQLAHFAVPQPVGAK
jgi:predicted homoserine dehydrogenase-like protein